MTVSDLEAEQFHQLERLKHIDSPLMPTKEPPTDVVKPHVLKLHEVGDGRR